MSEVLEPFKVPIFVEPLDLAAREEVLAGIRRDLEQSVRSQQDVTVYQVKELQRKAYAGSLVERIDEKFFALYQTMGYDTEHCRPVLTAMWANASAPGMAIHVHNHPNSFFSGVWYPYGCKGAGIVFKNPIPSFHVISPACKSYTPYNSGKWSYEFEADSLIFFPAWMEHWCEPQPASDELRYSVSFNFFLEGRLQRDASMSSLEV